MPQSAFADLIPGQPAAQPGLVPLTAPKPEVRQVGSQLGVVDPASGQFTPTYTAPEKPDKPDKAQFVPKGATQMMTPEGRVVPIPGVDGDPAKDMRPVLDDLKNVVRAAQRAKGRSKGWFMTGVGADWIGGNTPAGRSLRGDLSIIGANTAFDRLQKMRDESPTGGALGQVSNIELDLLKQSVAALDPGMSDVDFQNNMDTIIERYKGMYERLGGESSALSEEGESQRGGEGAGDIGFNTPDQPTNPFTPEQQRAYDAFLAGNPQATAAQLIAFTNKLGAGDLDPERAQEIIDVYRKTGEFAPGETAKRGLDSQQQAEVAEAREKAGALTAGVMGASDTVTLGTADEAAAGIDAFLDAMRGEGSFTDNYERSLETSRAIRDAVSEDNPVSYITGQVAGGFALPVGGATSAARLAGIGAAYGGAYGAGSSDGSITDRLVGAGIGAGVGTIAAGSFGLIGNHLAARGAGRAPSDRANLAAAYERQGVVPFPPDLGSKARQALTAGAYQSPVSAGTVIRNATNTSDSAAARLAEIATQAGTPQRQEVLGETAQRAAQAYIDDSGRAGAAYYDEARKLAQDAMPNAPRTFQNLNSQLRELRETEEIEGPLIAGLERLRSVIADDNGLRRKSVDAIRRMRTSVASEARTEGLRGTDYQRRAQAVLDDLREDIASQLPDDAAAAFRRADDQWRERLDVIDNVLENIIGKDGRKSAEQVADGLRNLSRRDSNTLDRFLSEIPPEDAGRIRGSLIQDMGRATSGTQNAAGDAFSFSTLATSWDKLPERSRNALFRGQHRQDIEDLVEIATASREAGRFANRSNTGGVAISTALGMGAAALTPKLLLAIAGNYIGGHLLANPRFSRWLAHPPKEPGRALKRLSRIAAREPAIAPELTTLQTVLQRAIPQAAAEQDEQQ